MHAAHMPPVSRTARHGESHGLQRCCLKLLCEADGPCVVVNRGGGGGGVQEGVGRAQEPSPTEGSLDPAGEGCCAVPRLGPR